MVRVGLTGPIGSGKSYVASRLRDKGFKVYDSDREAKRLVESDAEVRMSIMKLLGEQAYDSQGAYQRGWVAGRVFQDASLLQGLNDIIHPAVFGDFNAWVARQRSQGARVVFFESALLPNLRREYIEALDCIVLVQASKECRMRRAMARDAAPRDAIQLRMENQPSDAAYEAIASCTLRNDGDQAIERQIEMLLKQLQQR